MGGNNEPMNPLRSFFDPVAVDDVRPGEGVACGEFVQGAYEGGDVGSDEDVGSGGADEVGGWEDFVGVCEADEAVEDLGGTSVTVE